MRSRVLPRVAECLSKLVLAGLQYGEKSSDTLPQLAGGLTEPSRARRRAGQPFAAVSGSPM